jgi:hypothetical protein
MSAGHRVHLGQRAWLGERDDALRLAASQRSLQGPPLLLAHHVELDPDPGHPVELAHRGRDITSDLVAQRAAGHGQPDIDPHGPIGGDVNVLDHAELGDRTVDFGVADTGERLGDLIDRRRRGHGGRGRHDPNVIEPPGTSRNERLILIQAARSQAMQRFGVDEW